MAWRNWMIIILINIIFGLGFYISVMEKKVNEEIIAVQEQLPPEPVPCEGGGMGVVEISIGCEDYVEYGVVNEMLYDSIVIKVKRVCNRSPFQKI